MFAKLFRAYIRRTNKKIGEDTARKWRKRFSIGYMLIGWNLLSYMLYYLLRDKYPKVDDPDKFQKFLELQKIKQASVIKFSGFSKVEEYDVKINPDQSTG